MDTNVVLGIAAVVAVVLGLVAGWLIWGRKRRVDLAVPSLDDVPPAPTLARKPTVAELQAQLATFNPPKVAEQVQDPDNLMQLKGVGPRLAKTLYDMGIGKFEQIAAWTDADIARIESHLGPFSGRIVSDNWVEQARYLAAGDRAGFEARFGKLGTEVS
jgi:predicted flap endonuclease-1-like 5' DNA nuclease